MIPILVLDSRRYTISFFFFSFIIFIRNYFKIYWIADLNVVFFLRWQHNIDISFTACKLFRWHWIQTKFSLNRRSKLTCECHVRSIIILKSMGINIWAWHKFFIRCNAPQFVNTFLIFVGFVSLQSFGNHDV